MQNLFVLKVTFKKQYFSEAPPLLSFCLGQCCDQHHFDADPAFHCDADPVPDPIFHADADLDLTSQFSPDFDPPMLQNYPLRLPPFHFDPDPDPVFHFDSYPDPEIQPSTLMRVQIHSSKPKLCGSGSVELVLGWLNNVVKSQSGPIQGVKIL
jgi:hypothetical protein